MDTTAATTALIIALNDAKLDVTSRNRDSILADLIKVAHANGRTDVAHTLGVIAVDQRADVPAALATLVLDLYAAEVPQEGLPR